MKKWLRLSEVAKQIGMPVATTTERRASRRTVRRMLRRMEARDGVKYLHRDAKGGWLYMSVAKLEELLPWEPGTLTGIRRELTAINEQARDTRRKQNDHGSRLRGHRSKLGELGATVKAHETTLVEHGGRLSDLEKFRRGVDAFFAAQRDDG